MTPATQLRQHPARFAMTTPHPAHIAEQVAMMRPDLATTAAGDCISAVLTADPTLTADEVIRGLDQAAADHAKDLAHEEAVLAAEGSWRDR